MIYRYTMPWGDDLLIRADLTRAESPIYYSTADPDPGDNREWHSTPYRTADARHDERTMLVLVVDYLGGEWYMDPSSPASREDQLDAAINGAWEGR